MICGKEIFSGESIMMEFYGFSEEDKIQDSSKQLCEHHLEEADIQRYIPNIKKALLVKDSI